MWFSVSVRTPQQHHPTPEENTSLVYVGDPTGGIRCDLDDRIEMKRLQPFVNDKTAGLIFPLCWLAGGYCSSAQRAAVRRDVAAPLCGDRGIFSECRARSSRAQSFCRLADGGFPAAGRSRHGAVYSGGGRGITPFVRTKLDRGVYQPNAG
jgi:hypothetical protein